IERRTPLYFARADEDYLIVASNGGDERYPGWWYNIRSNKRVKIQDGYLMRECSAHEVERAEAEVLWPRLLAACGGFGGDGGHTRRPLTMFRLHPLAGEAALRRGFEERDAARVPSEGGSSMNRLLGRALMLTGIGHAVIGLALFRHPVVAIVR